MLRNSLIAFALIFYGVTAHGQTVIVDNADPEFTIEAGSWNVSSSTANYYGTDYTFADSSPAGITAQCRFRPNLPIAGYYYVSVWYNSGSNRAPDTPYTVYGDTVTSTVRVNQQVNGGGFYYIGQMHFAAGTGGSVTLSNNASPKVVMADAVKFEYAGETPGPEPGGQPPAETQEPEIRGLWVSRFEWPNGSQSTTKSNLDNIISTMANANFNALFLQVRGEMETLYPSPNEPWARAGFGYNPQSYDPMAYAISKAHAAGLEFHAYINTHVIYQGTSAPNVPGGQPVHPFFTHGNPTDPAHRDWVYHKSDGTPQLLGEGEENYDWAAPGVPGFQQWTREQALYVAQNYPVNGLHFDRIRFAGNGSEDPISVARRQIGSPSNPANLSIRTWNRDQITRLLNDIYGAVAEVNYNRPAGKPVIEISSAPYRGKSQQESVNQMLGEWTGIGAQDFFAPQVYTTNLTSFNNDLATNFPLANGRGVVAGLTRNQGAQTITNVAAEIEASRNQGAMGSIIFSYTGFKPGDFTAIRDSVYQSKVPTPGKPWLTSPTQAIIVGNVTGPENQPLLDAQLKRTGETYTWLSGADGFYAMLKVPSSQPLLLTASGTQYGYSPRSVAVPALQPGEVRRVNIQLGITAVDSWMLY